MTGTTFQRYEKKYMLTGDQYAALTQRLAGRLKPDGYGAYTVSSVYYDTDSFELIRKSIEKPFYKEKLRLRAYGKLDARSLVFLELKKKCGDVVYKRRAGLPYRDAENFLGGSPCGAQETQILKEIGYFLQTYPVTAKAVLCYDRTALTGIEDDRLRVTFDRDIRFRQTELCLNKGSWGTGLINPDNVLMEVKVPGAFPVWLSRIFSQLNIFPTSFSKYGSCYRTYLSYAAFPKEAVRSA